MKKLMFIAIMMVMTISASAMSYENARSSALFLTDKMAHELQLTDEQYNAAYEINLDYLMSVSDYSDTYSSYWTRRNCDIRCILSDWQYTAYAAANYFFRPVYWNRNAWHFRIYSRYTNRNYYYRSRPSEYNSYRGGNNRINNYYSKRTWNAPSYNNRSVNSNRNNNSSWRQNGSSNNSSWRNNGNRYNRNNNNRTYNNSNRNTNNRTYNNSNRNNNGRTECNEKTSAPYDNKDNNNNVRKSSDKVNQSNTSDKTTDNGHFGGHR